MSLLRMQERGRKFLDEYEKTGNLPKEGAPLGFGKYVGLAVAAFPSAKTLVNQNEATEIEARINAVYETEADKDRRESERLQKLINALEKRP